MRWLHESWCVGRWHLINPWRDKMGFSEVSAGFYRNLKILSFSLGEKDRRTLVYNLLSEFLILRRWNWEECLWQHSLLKKKNTFRTWYESRDTVIHQPYQISDVRSSACFRWEVLLCGLNSSCWVWIPGCPSWAGHCFEVWPSLGSGNISLPFPTMKSISYLPF